MQRLGWSLVARAARWVLAASVVVVMLGVLGIRCMSPVLPLSLS